MNSQSLDIVTEQFVTNPDRGEVSEFLNRVWARPTWYYTPEFFATYLDRPTGDPSLSIGLYSGGAIAGYLAHIPYRIRLHDREHDVVYGTFWTADPTRRGGNIALRLQRELMRRSRERGFDGFIVVTKADSEEEKAGKLVLSRLELPFCLACRFRPALAAPVSVRRRLAGVSGRQVQLYEPRFCDEARVLLESSCKSVELARIYALEDVHYILSGRPKTRTWIYVENGRVRGLFNVLRKKFVAQSDSVTAHVEHVAFGDLDAPACRAFLAGVFADPYWDEINAVYLLPTGCMDCHLFTGIGFLRTRYELSLYLAPLKTSFQTGPINSFHLDVF